ncbi:ankyrin repeat domain-containing protein [Endozoicomonas elysicola]|uniref:Uncharacterized protein n=1 Tax=Endozoicomonas elysicola TaxID=305900 RepID=A0A081KDJ1_9GAMM|nr:ankyrin repeat domain-containing protein [Endozoicomonas elysicola]KEI72217.1 hypothetical protein GV64_17110 [Endozoicomonas elysicola]
MIKWPTLSNLTATHSTIARASQPDKTHRDFIHLISKDHFELKKTRSLFCFSIQYIQTTEKYCARCSEKTEGALDSGISDDIYATQKILAAYPEWAACRAALLGDDLTIQGIMQEEPLDFLVRSDAIWGYTPLHYALRASDWKITALILNNMPDAILVKDKSGNTALHIAARYQFFRGFHELLQKEQGMKCLFMKNDKGLYPSCFIIRNAKSKTKICLRDMDSPYLSSLMVRYPVTAINIKQKLHYEAILARSILENPENRELVKWLTKVISILILNMSDIEFEKYRNDVNDFILRSNFPTSSLINHSSKRNLSATLLSLTNMRGCHTSDILSTIWRIVGHLLNEKNPAIRDKTFRIYAQFELIGRQHTVHPDWDAPVIFPENFIWLRKNHLGEAEIPSTLLKNIRPLKKLSSYYMHHTHYKMNSSAQELYLSGISGMCNAFYAIYPLLGIDFDSITGIRLAELMAAFNVSIAFHTFKECFDAFFITHTYLDYPEKLEVDFRRKTGAFTQLNSNDLHRKRVNC